MKKIIGIKAGLAAVIAAMCVSTFSAPVLAADTPQTSWNFSVDSTSNVAAYDAGYQANKATWAARKTFTGGWGPYTIAGN